MTSMLLFCPALIIKKSGHSAVGNVHQLAKKSCWHSCTNQLKESYSSQ